MLVHVFRLHTDLAQIIILTPISSLRAQPPYARPQFPSTCVHQWTEPFVWHNTPFQLAIPLRMCRRAQHRRLEVDVHILPIALVSDLDLMVDPTFPGLAVRKAMGKFVNIFNTAPVADLNVSGACAISA